METVSGFARDNHSFFENEEVKLTATLPCPYCSVTIQLALTRSEVWVRGDMNDAESPADAVAYGHCPSCGKLIVLLQEGSWHLVKNRDFGEDYFELARIKRQTVVFPKNVARSVEPEVPERYRDDYREACSVLPISPKASAALSRRIVQDVMRERYKIIKPTLAQEISEFIQLSEVPTFLSDAIDAIRHIGNFAAHPLKDSQTGSIVDVEDGEAEWLLEVIASLFDVAYVQPQRLSRRRDALNAKLAALGKPPMKG